MPTLRTVTVKPSGGDYTSLASAIAGEAANLVSLDRQLDIACYAMTDTTSVTISGFTTDATRYVRIYTPSTERHAGKWNAAKYNLSPSASYTYALIVNIDYVRVEDLQIQNAASNGDGNTRMISTADASASDIRLDTCIFYKSGSSAFGVNCQSGKVTIRNSLIYAMSADGVRNAYGSNSPTVLIDNCTIVNCTGYGVIDAGNTTTLRNVYSGGHATDAYSGTMSRTTCAHSSASTFSGSTASVPHSTATFTNVTGGSEDYHLVSGSALIDVGTDLSGTFTTDIDGATRTAPWDIGADEYVSAGGGGAPTPPSVIGRAVLTRPAIQF
jgi:hypothetical protein